MLCMASPLNTLHFFGTEPFPVDPLFGASEFIGDDVVREEWRDALALETAEGKDPFDDFDEDDFDDDFDDDFEEDWEDDLTEDEEFPDTFGGEDEDADERIEGPLEGDDEEESPFSDDPDFDDA